MTLYKYIVFILIFICGCMFCFPANAIVTGTRISHELIRKQQWEKASKQYDFTENYKVPKTNNSKHASAPPKLSWLKYLLAAIIIIALSALIIFLVLNIFKGMGERLKKDIKVQSSAEIENIENADLETMLTYALSSHSFKEAVRIQYLMLLKTLNQFRLVIWKKDKTNGQYVREMFGKKGFDLFRQLTVSFERIWYGDKQISEIDYQNLIPQFQEINKIVTTL